MDAKAEKLYSELRNTRQELLEKLMDENSSVLIRPIILEELFDTEKTLKKIEVGDFGKCEISGELIPEDLLTMVPTLKSLDDCSKLSNYYRKALFH